MIITCPHCQTRYQVDYQTIGAVGRKVQCAHCQQAWQATPQPDPKGDGDDRLFGEDEERELDAEFAAEAEKAEDGADVISYADAPLAVVAEAAPAKHIDPTLARTRERALIRRQTRMDRQLPLARVRRTARIVSLVLLALMIGALVTFRTGLVRQYPDLAGVYSAIGLGVNVVGLDFRDVHTLRSQKGGAEALTVNATIYSVTGHSVMVPSVVVSLLNDAGELLYEWSVNPQARDLRPGETIDFSTELPQPPEGATSVKLTFANGRGQIQTSSDDKSAATNGATS